MTRMKDSGIEWIGEVPEDWGITKLKYICRMQSGNNLTSLEISSENDGGKIFPVYGGNGQRGYYSDFTNEGNYCLVGRQGALAGNVHFVSGKFWATDHAIVVYEHTHTYSKYLCYLLKAMNLNQYAFETSAQPGLSVEKILQLEMIHCPKGEQTQIADFLDKKVAQLDEVKSLLEEQIKTLEDYRRSLIYETVTKGLDKTVSLKDSGVDWIGQIPEGWEVGRLKDFVKFQTGTTPPQSVGVNQDESGIPWFKPGDFSDNSIDLLSSENYITHEVVMQYNLSVYPKKTILLVGIASIGKVGYSAQPSYSNQQITALRTIGEIYPRYLAYLMFSSGRFIKETALYTVVPIINNQYLATMRLVLPSENEQKIIVEYLDRKLEQINQIIAIKREQIENINKQRQTLIYDYVTGKRRV